MFINISSITPNASTGAKNIACGFISTAAPNAKNDGANFFSAIKYTESAQKIASTESTCPHRQLLNMIAGLKTMNAEIITPAFCENDFVAILYAR